MALLIGERAALEIHVEAESERPWLQDADIGGSPRQRSGGHRRSLASFVSDVLAVELQPRTTKGHSASNIHSDVFGQSVLRHAGALIEVGVAIGDIAYGRSRERFVTSHTE